LISIFVEGILTLAIFIEDLASIEGHNVHPSDYPGGIAPNYAACIHRGAIVASNFLHRELVTECGLRPLCAHERGVVDVRPAPPFWPGEHRYKRELSTPSGSNRPGCKHESDC
jgi:hypothetical protein